MSFRVQQIDGFLPDGSLTLSMTNFRPVRSRSRAFLLSGISIPAMVSSGDTNQSLTSWGGNNYQCSAYFNSESEIIATRGNANVTVGSRIRANIIEYMGEPGGRNEIIVRNGGVPLSVSSDGVAVSFDSDVIADITNLARTVPFHTEHTTLNSGDLRSIMFRAEMVNASGDRMRFTKDLATGTVITYASPVEFTGANWTVQGPIQCTVIAGDVNQDFSITGLGFNNVANVNNTWVYVQRKAESARPADNTVWVYLTSTGNIRIRRRAETTGGDETYYVWLIENPEMQVQRIGTPDGVADWANLGVTAFDPRTIAIPNPVDLSRSFVQLQAGSSETTATTALNTLLWEAWLSAPNEISAWRNNSEPNGSTEPLAHVIQLPGFIPQPMRFQQNTLLRM